MIAVHYGKDPSLIGKDLFYMNAPFAPAVRFTEFFSEKFCIVDRQLSAIA